MRLALIVSNLDFSSGAQRVLSTMANHWAARGHSIVLMALEGRGRPFYDLHPAVVHKPLNYSWGRRGWIPSPLVFLGNLLRLRRALLTEKPDAVISFLDDVNVRVLLSLTGSGLPVLVSERNDPFESRMRPGWDTLRRWTYPWARGIVVQTERAAGYFRPRLNSKLVVIPNPVTIAGAGEAPEVAVGNHTIVAVGRLVPQKGFDLLLRAFAMIRGEHPGWDLLVLGEGPQRAALEALARDLDLGSEVRLAGRVASPHAVLRRAGLYVLPSRFEGFPNALCEAMACGAPVLAADCPSGPREIITDGVDGLLVPVEDMEALAAGMRRLMDDGDLRRRLGGNALQVTRRFGTEAVMSLWETAIREKCGGVVR